MPDRRSSGSLDSIADLELSGRNVHCVLGVPLDIATMTDVLNSITKAASTRERLFVSTLNLNFIVLAQQDVDFRKSLIQSDLCLADGIAVKYLGKLLGAPVCERVAGSDILNAFWERPAAAGHEPLKVFFFGGTEEAGNRAADAINRHQPEKVVCVGNLCPGYGSLEDMSGDAIIAAINDAQPDFLIVALGARKGQAWIMHNMTRLEVPVISHLGATINFLAGTVKRAPLAWQNIGLEWLWRIRQEPVLAKRYWNDGMSLLKLLLVKVAPLSIRFAWNRWRWQSAELSVDVCDAEARRIKLAVKGNLTSRHVDELVRAAARALDNAQSVSLDLSAVNWVDTKAMGSLLLLSETIRKNDGRLSIVSVPAGLRRTLRLNGLNDLLTQESCSNGAD